ncbi:hypothetical protein P879_07685 [Paragonimus westermani]|uniref:Uncharacterized protein n=1 Tax=Paragonimus westermani TaxID=34504 RepID=A0A8T0D4X5_9TREM|nr:hypothetical protein P879_07685 [Paragonimus westermani]
MDPQSWSSQLGTFLTLESYYPSSLALSPTGLHTSLERGPEDSANAAATIAAAALVTRQQQHQQQQQHYHFQQIPQNLINSSPAFVSLAAYASLIPYGNNSTQLPIAMNNFLGPHTSNGQLYIGPNGIHQSAYMNAANLDYQNTTPSKDALNGRTTIGHLVGNLGGTLNSLSTSSSIAELKDPNANFMKYSDRQKHELKPISPSKPDQNFTDHSAFCNDLFFNYKYTNPVMFPPYATHNPALGPTTLGHPSLHSAFTMQPSQVFATEYNPSHGLLNGASQLVSPAEYLPTSLSGPLNVPNTNVIPPLLPDFACSLLKTLHTQQMQTAASPAQNLTLGALSSQMPLTNWHSGGSYPLLAIGPKVI